MPFTYFFDTTALKRETMWEQNRKFWEYTRKHKTEFEKLAQNPNNFKQWKLKHLFKIIDNIDFIMIADTNPIELARNILSILFYKKENELCDFAGSCATFLSKINPAFNHYGNDFFILLTKKIHYFDDIYKSPVFSQYTSSRFCTNKRKKQENYVAFYNYVKSSFNDKKLTKSIFADNIQKIQNIVFENFIIDLCKPENCKKAFDFEKLQNEIFKPKNFIKILHEIDKEKDRNYYQNSNTVIIPNDMEINDNHPFARYERIYEWEYTDAYDEIERSANQ